MSSTTFLTYAQHEILHTHAITIFCDLSVKTKRLDIKLGKSWMQLHDDIHIPACLVWYMSLWQLNTAYLKTTSPAVVFSDKCTGTSANWNCGAFTRTMPSWKSTSLFILRVIGSRVPFLRPNNLFMGLLFSFVPLYKKRNSILKRLPVAVLWICKTYGQRQISWSFKPNGQWLENVRKVHGD